MNATGISYIDGQVERADMEERIAFRKQEAAAASKAAQKRRQEANRAKRAGDSQALRAMRNRK